MLGRFAASAAEGTSRRCVVNSCRSAQRLGNFQSQQGHPQDRRYFSVWVDVIRVKKQRAKDKKDKTVKFQMAHEDPEQVVRRHTDEVRSDGESLLDLMFYNDRHEKAWRKRQRLANLRRYEFDKKHVTDLAKYIAFVQDNEAKK